MNYETIINYINKNEYDKAFEQLELWIAQNPNNDEAFYLKGKLHQKLGQWDNAITAYQSAIDVNANSKAVVALEMLYDILNSMNNKIISA